MGRKLCGHCLDANFLALEQVRARSAPPHPALDSVYPAFAALAAFEAALLDPQSDAQLPWTTQLAQQVHEYP